MIPCVVQGKTFSRFFEQHYEKGLELRSGPAGKEWALHHGSATMSPSREHLEAKYSELVRLPPGEALNRYRCDYIYLAADTLDESYRKMLQPTGHPRLFRVETTEQ